MLKLRVQIPDIGKEYDVQCNEKAYVEDVIGVIWAIDVANGYITEKSGGESKRAAEAVSDFILDIGKTKKGEE